MMRALTPGTLLTGLAPDLAATGRVSISPSRLLPDPGGDTRLSHPAVWRDGGDLTTWRCQGAASTGAASTGRPPTVLDLTVRGFDVGREHDHLATAELFIGVVLAASAGDLARTLRWPVAKARGHLDELAAAARVTRSGNRCLASRVAGQFR
jgi:hypothetical protein